MLETKSIYFNNAQQESFFNSSTTWASLAISVAILGLAGGACLSAFRRNRKNRGIVYSVPEPSENPIVGDVVPPCNYPTYPAPIQGPYPVQSIPPPTHVQSYIPPIPINTSQNVWQNAPAAMPPQVPSTMPMPYAPPMEQPPSYYEAMRGAAPAATESKQPAYNPNFQS